MSSDMAPRNRDKVALRRAAMNTLWHPIVFLLFRLNYLSFPTHPHACPFYACPVPTHVRTSACNCSGRRLKPRRFLPRAPVSVARHWVTEQVKSLLAEVRA